ncbi:PREDICTED: G patch domain-containing protein 1 [Nanorana parkeri]|uniref:G patch domain-containing protein 1 n=1 Tax=Nanorana parkeri TaxID=125878 RepID=UPI000854C4E6|nr:PREDICTED: G patch domain-containing protein 1 [Nanorana parkeri]
MAAQDSDGEEDFVTYGKPLEPYEEGEKPKKPTPLHEQTVKDEKGRYKRFHGAFTGGFSAGYFNSVGSKEGWAPATFLSSRHGRSEQHARRPEDFMDEEDLGEFGIAPKEILTTDDFASKTKDKVREKARELAAVTAPIPGSVVIRSIISSPLLRITVGVQLLRQMGWKEGQGVGPRTKRKVRKQGSESSRKVYGCVMPPTGSEGSEDEEDEYLPDNVTFAPKDVTPIDFTVKDNVRGLGYRGLDPRQALFGSLDSQVNLFGDGSDRMFSTLGDVRHSKGRKVGISGQAFGVGALEDDDDDIYGTDSLSKYDTVLREEESGDGLYGWTAPKEYKHKKGSSKELQYIGKVLEGFSIATQPASLKKIYPAPELPRDYRPVHYFRPVLNAASQTSATLQALLASSQNPAAEPKQEPLPSRHQLRSSQRREMLGEEALKGPTSVLELLSDKDRERIKDVKQTIEEQRLKAQKLAQEAIKNRFQAASADEAHNRLQDELLDRRLVPPNAEEFRPFENNAEKQKRYEVYIRKLHDGQKDDLESCLDSNMTEWEQSREREEFMRSAMLYKPTNSSLSSRFTRGKHEDNSDSVEVPRDEESDLNDKSAAVKMKMFGRLTRDRFEWHPDKLLCKRFNIPDPYPGSTSTGLPKVKRDKYSVFNFLTFPEPQPETTCAAIQEKAPETSDNKQKKSSRWDMSSAEKKNKDSLSDFLSQARSKSEVKEEQEERGETSAQPPVPTAASGQSQTDQDAEEEEETRPPIDLFKAIFADSSDEKSSSSEEESDEDSALPGEEAKGSRPETAPPSIVRETEPKVHPPITPVAPARTDSPDDMEAEEEFGPRLPPPLPSGTLRTSSDSPSLSRDDPSKKQKRHKDKHKAKKEHKRKKEKKKKHKKQKHKNKHKNKKENVNGTDSEDSSADLSDAEEADKITPRELLKRLKNLPIPH